MAIYICMYVCMHEWIDRQVDVRLCGWIDRCMFAKNDE